jgi:UDPglucose 6-dehydrogenase
MSNIAVLGIGYVGITTCIGFAELEHNVLGIDIDEEKIIKLGKSITPIYEKDSETYLAKLNKKGNLKFSTDKSQLGDYEYIFLCLPTPQNDDGSADISFVEDAVKEIKSLLGPQNTIVIKSTVPVNTWKKIKELVGQIGVNIISNPEFLREGSAIEDFLKPDRIVVGAETNELAKKFSNLYKDLNAELVLTDNTSAEIIKYASNSYLALRLSFVNEIAAYSESIGANGLEVLKAMGLDKRIGKSFLKPGPGWGGMCFPKDVSALRHSANEQSTPIPLLDAALESNSKAHERVINKLKKCVGNDLSGLNVAVWGLAFKANTDDTRFSPAISVIELLLKEGVEVTAYDPAVDKIENLNIETAENISQSVSQSDAIILLTEWKEFTEIDPEKIKDQVKQRNIIDTRNILDKTKWEKAGFNFLANGY